jgi:hypothetical protein
MTSVPVIRPIDVSMLFVLEAEGEVGAAVASVSVHSPMLSDLEACLLSRLLAFPSGLEGGVEAAVASVALISGCHDPMLCLLETFLLFRLVATALPSILDREVGAAVASVAVISGCHVPMLCLLETFLLFRFVATAVPSVLEGGSPVDCLLEPCPGLFARSCELLVSDARRGFFADDFGDTFFFLF